MEEEEEEEKATAIDWWPMRCEQRPAFHSPSLKALSFFLSFFLPFSLSFFLSFCLPLALSVGLPHSFPRFECVLLDLAALNGVRRCRGLGRDLTGFLPGFYRVFTGFRTAERSRVGGPPFPSNLRG